MLENNVSELFKFLLFGVLVVFAVGVYQMLSQTGDVQAYQQDVNDTIQRYGGFTSAARQKLASDSSSIYGGRYSVDYAATTADSANSSVTDVNGKKVDFATETNPLAYGTPVTYHIDTEYVIPVISNLAKAFGDSNGKTAWSQPGTFTTTEEGTATTQVRGTSAPTLSTIADGAISSDSIVSTSYANEYVLASSTPLSSYFPAGAGIESPVYNSYTNAGIVYLFDSEGNVPASASDISSNETYDVGLLYDDTTSSSNAPASKTYDLKIVNKKMTGAELTTYLEAYVSWASSYSGHLNQNSGSDIWDPLDVTLLGETNILSGHTSSDVYGEDPTTLEDVWENNANVTPYFVEFQSGKVTVASILTLFGQSVDD